MKKTTFDLQVQRLRSSFGVIKYSDEKIDIFWRRLRFAGEAQIENAIDLLIADAKFAPVLSDIENLVRDSITSNRNAYYKRQQKTLNNCSNCGNTGIKVITHENGNDYHYRCRCQWATAKDLSNYIPWEPR